MVSLRTLSASVLLLATAPLAGCNDDCQEYCRRQANYINQCLPEFGQEWDTIGGDQFATKGEFIDLCEGDIAEHEQEVLEETCGEDTGESDWDDCADLVADSVERVCAENIGQFRTTCVDYWTSTTSFVPGEFVPGDDDDSATGDDDTTGDDDDSASGDDDTTGDDDDSASGDDDTTGDDDDDDSASGDDDSTGDDDSATGDDDSAAGDDDSASGDDDSAAGDDDSAR